ncbi:MAG: hypothetical protein R3D34_14825 [Nitratireductor sp.]
MFGGKGNDTINGGKAVTKLMAARA